MTRKTSMIALMAALSLGAATVPSIMLAQEATTTATETLMPARMDDGPMGDGMMGGPRFDFDAMDADKDGKVTTEEISAWRAAQIKGIDADSDGKITEAELTAHITAQMTARAAEMAKNRITAQDADGDGALSVEELAAPPVPVRLIERLDTDGDGAVSKDELAAGQAAMAERMDDRGEGHGRHGRGHGGFGGWFGKGADN